MKIRRDGFQRIGGFDEQLFAFQLRDLVARLSSAGKIVQLTAKCEAIDSDMGPVSSLDPTVALASFARLVVQHRTLSSHDTMSANKIDALLRFLGQMAAKIVARDSTQFVCSQLLDSHARRCTKHLAAAAVKEIDELLERFVNSLCDDEVIVDWTQSASGNWTTLNRNCKSFVNQGSCGSHAKYSC